MAAIPPDVNRNAVTVLRIEGSDRANKLVRRLPDGTIEKLGGVESGIYRAQQVPVPDRDVLAEVLANLAEDPRLVLMLGLFHDAGPDPFMVWPRKRIVREIHKLDPRALSEQRISELATGWHQHQGQRIVARTRANTMFSSWCYLDRDVVDGMPEELAGLSRDDWLGEMAELWPAFGPAAKVIIPSTSSRVLVDGEPWSTKPSFHCFFQIDNPDDLRNRVWPQLLVKSFGANVLLSDCRLGFMREKIARDGSGRVAGRVPWSIWDPTTCWPERLVFDGCPVVEGAGLTVAPPVAPEVIEGNVVRTADFADLTAEQQQPAAAQKVTLAREHRPGPGGARVAVLFTTSPIMDLDHELDTAQGAMTARTYWLSSIEHLRCQAPYRPSTSWAAYLGRHRSGEPFCYDAGADTKFTLSAAARIGPSPEEFMGALEAWLAEHDDKISDPAALAEGERFLRDIAMAMQRHERGETEVEAMIDRLAGRLSGPYGVSKTKLTAAIRREFKAGRKAAREAEAAAAATAAAVLAAAGGVTVRGAIAAWYAERYRPVMRRPSGAVYSETEGGWISFQGLYPDEDLRERMMAAVDFPRDGQGRPLESAVPRLYRDWSRFAWGDLLRALPFENAPDAPRTLADEEFVRMIARLFEVLVFLAPPDLHENTSSKLVPLATGAWRYGVHAAITHQRPRWVQVEGYLCWARVKNGRCWLAIKPGLASPGQLQRGANAEIAHLSDTALTRRCQKARIGLPSKLGRNANLNVFNIKGKPIRATILRPSFVHRLGLLSDDPRVGQWEAAAQAEKGGKSPSVQD